jgi:hypothetical protein
MPFNGSGVFQRVRNWVADATAGIKIRADYHDSEDDGFAAGLSNCVTKDGQTTITQNIPFNNKRVTGLADPVNPQDAATKAYADTKLTAGGGQSMTGDLVIHKDTPTLVLDSTGSGGSSIEGQKNGLMRWLMRLGDGSGETGSGNAGSNFDLSAYDDAGAFLGTALIFERATGLGHVKAPPTHFLGIANKQYVDDAAALRVAKTGDVMTGTLVSPTTAVLITAPTTMNTIEVRGYTHAGMNFTIQGVFTANFGLQPDGNFYYGGGSLSGGAYRFWTTKDFTAVPSMAEMADLRARIEALEAKGA